MYSLELVDHLTVMLCELSYECKLDSILTKIITYDDKTANVVYAMEPYFF